MRQPGQQRAPHGIRFGQRVQHGVETLAQRPGLGRTGRIHALRLSGGQAVGGIGQARERTRDVPGKPDCQQQQQAQAAQPGRGQRRGHGRIQALQRDHQPFAQARHVLAVGIGRQRNEDLGRGAARQGHARTVVQAFIELLHQSAQVAADIIDLGPIGRAAFAAVEHALGRAGGGAFLVFLAGHVPGARGTGVALTGGGLGPPGAAADGGRRSAAAAPRPAAPATTAATGSARPRARIPRAPRPAPAKRPRARCGSWSRYSRWPRLP